MADAAAAGSCYTNQITVQPVEATGVNSTCISSPHIVQYPKIPKRDDGRWMALGSIIGSLIGKFANGDKLDAASDAESTWRDLNDQLKAKGLAEWARVPDLRTKAYDIDAKLGDRATKNWGYEGDEKAYADKLEACDDKLYERLCTLANCGYIPDYDGIYRRARADAAAMATAKRQSVCREIRRYNVCQTSAMCMDSANTEIMAAVSASTQAREAERQAAWKYNFDTTMQAAQVYENTRMGRLGMALKYESLADDIEANRYKSYIADADNSLRLGNDMLASAGQNYAWLAESLRRSAEKDTGNFSTLGALIIPLLMTLTGSCDFTTKDCDCVAPAAATKTA